MKNIVKSLGEQSYVNTDAGMPGSSGSDTKTKHIIPNLTKVGNSISEFYGLQVEGVYKDWDEVNKGPYVTGNTKPGDYKYKDVNGDGKIDQNDYVFIGSPLPKLTYGFYVSGGWWIFDYNVSFQGSYGNKIFNLTKYYTDGNREYNYSTRRLNAWSEENSSSSETQLGYTNYDNWDLPSSAYVESGSYLRLKDLVIGATLPDNLTKKLKINKLRIYGEIQNVFTITNYSGFDPEVGNKNDGSNGGDNNNLDLGVDRGTYPQARTFLCGLNFAF